MEKKDISIEPKEVYKIITPISFIILFLFIFLYYIFIGRKDINNLNINSFLFIFILIGATFIHEIIHGISFIVFGKVPFNKIKFGIILKYLTPYAYCNHVISISTYRIALVMPTILLGVIPLIYSFIASDFLIFLLGTLMFIGGFGDLLIVWVTRGVKKGTLVLDHDKKVGCYIIIQ